MVKQNVKRSTKSIGASNSHETLESKSKSTGPKKSVLKSASGTKRTVIFDDALAKSFVPKTKRPKKTEATVLAQYRKLDDEKAADSDIDRDARLRVLRDILSYIHGHSKYDKKLLNDYSLLQYLLYSRFYTESKSLPKAPKQVRKSSMVRLLTNVLKAYGEAVKKYMNEKD